MQELFTWYFYKTVVLVNRRDQTSSVTSDIEVDKNYTTAKKNTFSTLRQFWDEIIKLHLTPNPKHLEKTVNNNHKIITF